MHEYIRRLIQHLKLFIRSLIRSLTSDLDVIISNGSPGFRQHNPDYLISFLIMIFACSYGTIGLANLTTKVSDPWQLSLESILANPRQLFHAGFPPQIWTLTDPGLAIVILGVLAGLGQFYLPAAIAMNRRIRIGSERARIGRADQCRLIRMRTRIYQTSRWSFIIVFASVYIFMNGNAYLNGAFVPRAGCILFWSLLYPLFLCFIIHFYFVIPFYLILASIYVRIQQKTIFVRLQRRKNRLMTKKPAKMNKNISIKHFLLRTYRNFRRLNVRLLGICLGLDAYDRFWSAYLTVIFFAFVVIQCYMMYIWFFTNAAVLLRLVFLTTSFNLTALQFALIWQCALMARWNTRFTQQNSAFHIQFSKQIISKNCGLHCELLKTESLQHNRLLRCYAFKIFGNHRITTKTFQILIAYISLFFLFIVKSYRQFGRR